MSSFLPSFKPHSTTLSSPASTVSSLCSTPSESSDDSRSPSPSITLNPQIRLNLDNIEPTDLKQIFQQHSRDNRLALCHTGLKSSKAEHLLTLSIAGLRSILSHDTQPGEVVYVVESPAVVFPPVTHTPSFSSPHGGNIPTEQEWINLWKAWDLVTLSMIPVEMLHQKPIDLRHKCLFYLGHIPTFLDMLLSKAIGGPPTEPACFWSIFERGIDPHVDDPDHCHNHSEVPEADEDWPSLENVILFRDRVRKRLLALYDELRSGKRSLTRNIARTLVMTHEHEGFHVETLLYMLIQRAGSGTLPPSGFTVPPWNDLAEQWNNQVKPSVKTVTVGPADITLGHCDSESEDSLPEFEHRVQGHTFGWDNENPPRTAHVKAIEFSWRPITNQEFQTFYNGEGKGKVTLPKSWIEQDGEIKVRTVYGPVPFTVAQHWPVLTSYDDIAVFAHAQGGRLPTEAELRLFLERYDVGYEGGANIAFRNWHPVPATTGLDRDGGKGSNGGIWEWTSTMFDTHEGLVPTKLFPGYSTDFFDGVHHVVLGASYATIPRLQRRTVRNFYQHNYPYAWVGGRVVFDSN